VYNGEKFLPEAVKSVLAQTFDSFELIVVDDGSSDRSVEIVSQFAAGDGRIKLHRNETNLGLFGNYNKCVELGTGRYIKPFAQDDLLSETALARMVHELDRRSGVSLVACARDYVDPQGSSTQTLRHCEADQELDGKQAAFEMLSLISNFIGEPCAVMYRREHVGSGFAAHLPQLGDIEYWARLLQSGNLFLIADVLCKFRVHQGNQTKKNIASLDYFADMIAVQELYQDFLSERGCGREAFTRRILSQAIDLINYARNVGIDYRQSDFSAVKRRPAELGNLLIDALKRLSAIEPEYASMRARVEVVEEENKQLHSELASMINSPSWKVTAGLRGFKKIVAGAAAISQKSGNRTEP